MPRICDPASACAGASLPESEENSRETSRDDTPHAAHPLQPIRVFPMESVEMTRTFGAALGFLLVILFFAAVAVESTRAASQAPSVTSATRR